ncbi:MAG TPA: response regulator [Polyangiaceae bacterium]|nr:response regulator [Polyangiaceae bacterium]
MKRILFVDDEMQVLDGLRVSLRKQRHLWDMVFAQGGEGALAQLRAAPFDVVVSDMRMPGLDGATLLGRVKEEFPGVIRIILSGHSERESIMRALPVCHQFLAKPCDGDTLKSVIERACGLHALLESDALRRVVGGTDRLPSLPRVYWELTRTMSDPEVSAKQVATVVEQDPAMCAKLLQLVNSSYFGLARRIVGVESAVAYLGLELVRSLALTAHVFRAADAIPAIPGFSLTRIQETSLLVGAVAKRMASEPKRAEEAFTAALLHDVGRIVLALSVPSRVGALIGAAKTDPRPEHERELDELGVTHAEVGAYLLGLWGLPVPIVEAAAFHHAPASVPQRTFETLGIVHVADALVRQHLPGAGDPSPGPDLAYLERLGVAGELPKWSAITTEEVGRRASRPARG